LHLTVVINDLVWIKLGCGFFVSVLCTFHFKQHQL